MNNGYEFLITNIGSNENLKDIKLEGNKISYKGQVINLKDFNINYFIEQNPKFKEDLANMTPDAVFNIIKLHVEYMQAENAKKEEKAKEYIDTTPILKPFKIVKRTDSEKNEYSYIHYVDINGNHHVLEGLSYKDLFEAYKEIIQSDSMIKTDKEVFELLKTRGKEISLESLNEAEQRVDAKESHLNNLKKLAQDNNSAMELNIQIVGNEDNNIYINNGKVITIDEDKEGTKTMEKHDATTNKNGSIDSITVEDEIELISFNEYVKYIMGNNNLSNEDKDKIKAYEDFLFDVITYKEYLTPELKDVYTKWADFYQKLYYAPVSTELIQETLKKYSDMQERSEKIEITNAREEVLKLQRKNPDNKSTGFVSVTVYVILTILMGIVIGSLLFIAS